MTTKLLTDYEADRLRGIAWDIWSGIWPDVCIDQAEAESYDMIDIIEVAFDANRIDEYPEAAELFRTAVELIGYRPTLDEIANNGFSSQF